MPRPKGSKNKPKVASKPKEEQVDTVVEVKEQKKTLTANQLLQQFLNENNVTLTFDTTSGVINTDEGFVMVDEPQLVIKAEYNA